MIPNVNRLQVKRIAAIAASLAVLGVAAAVLSASDPGGNVLAESADAVRTTAAGGFAGAGPLSSNPAVHEVEDTVNGTDDKSGGSTHVNETTYDNDVTNDDDVVYDNDTTTSSDDDVTYDNDTTNTDNSVTDDHSDNSVSDNHQDGNTNTNSNQAAQETNTTGYAECSGGQGSEATVENGESGVTADVDANVVVCPYVSVGNGNNVNVGDVVDVVISGFNGLVTLVTG